MITVVTAGRLITCCPGLAWLLSGGAEHGRAVSLHFTPRRCYCAAVLHCWRPYASGDCGRYAGSTTTPPEAELQHRHANNSDVEE